MIAELHHKATDAARAAAAHMLTQIGGRDQPMCGFAWVTVYGIGLNSKEGKEFARVGFKKSYHKGIELRNPSGYPGQNIDCKVAGARAYADVLKAAGYRVSVGERDD